MLEPSPPTNAPTVDGSQEVSGGFPHGRIEAVEATDEELKESMARHRKTFSLLHTAVLIFDRDTEEIIEANAAALLLFGYSKQLMLGMNAMELVADPDSMREYLANAPRGQNHLGKAFLMEKRRNGREFPSEVWVAIFPDGARDLVCITINDVSKRVEAQRAASESGERFKDFTELGVDLLFEIDTQHRITFLSGRCFKWFGLEPEELIGQSLLELLSKLDVDEETNQKHLAAIEAQEPYQIEFGWRDFTGKRRVNLSKAKPVFGQDGEYQGYRFVARDITAVRDAYEMLEHERMELANRVEERTAELTAANQQLARTARAKDEFLASVSHELRTPLNAILGLSQALKEKVLGSLNAKQIESLHYIEESGKHLLALINDILDLAKVGVDELSLEKRPVNVNGVSEASIAFVKQLATKKSIRISVENEKDVEFCFADERRLKQILVNLLSNAVKFTPEGGSIGLRVESSHEEGMIRFSVWDTGIGIDKAHMSSLFEPFVQLDSGLTREYDGSGLGLSLVLTMTQLHGGRVEVDSDLGKGSTFTVSIPSSPEGLGEAVPQDEATGAAHSNQAVNEGLALIVENSKSASDQLRRYLSPYGIKTIVVSSGKQVLKEVKAINPDIVYLDLLLPDISGWDVLMNLKTGKDTHGVPVVITSVLDERDDVRAQQANEYLVKPFSHEQVEQTLRLIKNPASRLGIQTHGAQEERNATNSTILLVEDNETNILTIRDYLEAKTYNVVVARNGLEAIELTKAARPKLILMDVQMPGMDGIEATRRIRELSDRGDVPIVALTALAMPGDRERCVEAGMNDYLSKPVQLGRLTKLIDKYLNDQTGSGTTGDKLEQLTG